LANEDQNSTDEARWHQLRAVLESFSTAWETVPPEPNVEDFLGDFSESAGVTFHVAALVELIKIDMEQRSQRKLQQFSVAEYVQRWPVLEQNGQLPIDLLYEETRIRKQHGDSNENDGNTSDFAALQRFANLIDPEFTRTTSALAKFRADKFEPGMSIDDFDLLAKLGKGAFASVFLARQKSMQRLVALKISADHGVEGQTLARLDHPHIVRVYDQRVVNDPSVHSPARLMYMQYIAGSSLNEVIRGMPDLEIERTGVFFITLLDRLLDETGEVAPVQSSNRDWIRKASWPQVVSRIGSQLADALAYSHRKGVLHRDIKPANVLVDSHGNPKLADFNTSFSSKIAGTTAETFFGGSLGYMSPEQIEACSIEFERTPDMLDPRSDVYSLGVVLFELLTGSRPFMPEEEVRSPLAQLKHSVSVRNAGLSPQEKKSLGSENSLLTDAIQRCLAPKPGDRFRHADSLQRQLTWASQESTSQYVCDSDRGWRHVVASFPFLSIIVTGLVISVFATWFVASFNAAEAIDAADQELFSWLRRGTNRVVYPVVMVVSLLLVLPVRRALTTNESSSASADPEKPVGLELGHAIKRNLMLGSHLAIVFAIAWSVSGISYPLLLSAFGAEVSSQTWSDFFLSHFLAGLITASYFYCTTTAFSLAAWHPRLLQRSLQREIHVDVDEELTGIQNRIRLYQVIAIATPFAAIAVLVYLRSGLNTFAVGVLSTASLFGMGILAWTARTIENSIKTLRDM
jgi:serine/threonine protein kinase